jgi:hypothetical protein
MPSVRHLKECNIATAERNRCLQAAIIEFLNFAKVRGFELDLIMICGVLVRLGYDVRLGAVATLLQELASAGQLPPCWRIK